MPYRCRPLQCPELVHRDPQHGTFLYISATKSTIAVFSLCLLCISGDKSTRPSGTMCMRKQWLHHRTQWEHHLSDTSWQQKGLCSPLSLSPLPLQHSLAASAAISVAFSNRDGSLIRDFRDLRYTTSIGEAMLLRVKGRLEPLQMSPEPTLLSQHTVQGSC